MLQCHLFRKFPYASGYNNPGQKDSLSDFLHSFNQNQHNSCNKKRRKLELGYISLKESNDLNKKKMSK